MGPTVLNIFIIRIYRRLIDLSLLFFLGFSRTHPQAKVNCIESVARGAAEKKDLIEKCE
jgi:hypothetical protein